MSTRRFEALPEATPEDEEPRTTAADGSAKTPSGPDSRWGPLAFREYRLFFTGTMFSNLGLWMQQFAVGWLAVQLAVNDGKPELGPFYVGLTGAARIVPAIVFGLAAGVVADRFDRRKLLQATRGGMALVIAIMGALTLTGTMNITLLFILTVFAAAVGSLDGPARLSLSPMLVPPRFAFSAISLTRAFMQAASLTAPLIGGLLVIPFGVGGVMVVNTALYVFSGLGMGRLGPVPPTGARENPIESFRQGVSFVSNEPTTRAYIIASAVLILLAGSITQLMPTIAYNLLGVGAVELSYMLSALGVGALIGSLLITTMSRWPRPGLALVGMAFALGAVVLLLGLQTSLLPAIVLVGILGAIMQIYTGGVGNIIQMIAPNEFRGRVIGLWLLNFGVGQQLGTVILGTAGSVFGLSTAMLAAGAAVLLTAGVMVRTRVIREVSPEVMIRSEQQALSAANDESGTRGRMSDGRLDDSNAAEPATADRASSGRRTPDISTRWGALAFPEYRLFFAGTTFSNVGMWMQQFAVGWVAVQLAERDGNPSLAPFYIGLTGAARFVPTLVVGLAAGVIADRYDRRRLLLLTRGGMAVIVGIMATLILSDSMTVGLLMALTFGAGCMGALDGPARLSFTPMLVPPSYAFTAISFSRASMQTANFVAPFLGGLLVIPLGIGGVLVVISLLYILAGLGTGRLGALPPNNAPENPIESFRQGFGFVWGEPTIRAYVAVSALVILLGGAVSQLMPTITYNVLHLGVVELSYLLTALGMGALAGSLWSTSMNRWPRPGAALIVSAFALSVSVLLLGLQSSLFPALVLAFTYGVTLQIYTGGVGNVVQMLTPNQYRGRVIAVWTLNYGVSQQLGVIILGTVGSLIGLSTTVVLSGIGLLVAVVIMVRSRVIRELGQDVMARG